MKAYKANILILLTIILSVPLTIAHAQFDTLGGLTQKNKVKAPDEKHVTAELIAASTTFIPGEEISAGLKLSHKPHWHTYWEYAGDAGLPTSINWELTEGFEGGEIEWPVPIVFEVSGIIGYGYENEVVLPVKIKTPADFTIGKDVEIKGTAFWLECKEMCIPGKQEISLALKAANEITESRDAALIDKFLKQIPKPIRSYDNIKLSVNRSKVPAASNDPFALSMQFTGDTIDLARMDAASFLPIPGENVILEDRPKFEKVEDGFSVSIDGVVTPFHSDADNSIRGVIQLPIKGETEILSAAVNVPLIQDKIIEPTSAATTKPFVPKQTLISYIRLIILAIIGGLILNIMPCVLPVISLKVFSFVRQANESRGRIFYLGMMYCLGVLVSFWALAAFMIVLTFSTGSANWGAIQQYPIFNTAFAIIVFVFALNMLGVFEISAPSGAAIQSASKLQEREGPVGAFFTGALATLLATPCTAPLLGPVLGIALTLPPSGIVMMFTAMGIGMALPFAIMAVFPAWTRFIPKPGPWMVHFKQIMGFLLIATAAWLVSVLISQLEKMHGNGFASTFPILAFMTMLGVGCWIIGTYITFSSTRSRRIIIWAVTLGMSVASYALLVRPALYPSEDHTDWIPFTKETLSEYQSDNSLIFVDFTADWCLTCKVNEKRVLETDEIKNLFSELDVVAIKADFTNRDEDILKILQSYGRSGVPLYVIYPPNGSEPIVLPELITKSMVIDGLNKAANQSY